MTEDEVMEMARVSGVLASYDGFPSALKRFVLLVAAHEREECIEACAPYEGDHYVNKCIDAIRDRANL